MTDVLWEMFERSGSVSIYVFYKLITLGKKETKGKTCKAANIE